jgi:L-asparaginase / beta-aspartyl-peptidase
MNVKKLDWSIAIHGGAGTITRGQLSASDENRYYDTIKNSLNAGENILASGGSALDAVCEAVRVMEDSPLFNAGKGAVFNYDGNHEMDASVMDGKNRMAGAVTGVSLIKNPVFLSKMVMQKSEHVLLSGKGAEEFAKNHGLVFESPEYFHNDYRYQQWQSVKNTGETLMDHSRDKKFGTVGAVAFDSSGNLASATSTGGMTNKRYSRVGDTPLIGAGTWADNNTCAVSCTGHGEYFIRWVVAYDVACQMEYQGVPLPQACHHVIQEKLKNAGGEGGLIAIDREGRIVLEFNSDGMYRGARDSSGYDFTGIYRC